MKKRKSILEPKDRVYLLKNEKEPLAYFIASRDTPRNRLLYYDEENNINRPLRYARNATSPFQDEQDNNVILEPIVFEDGVLRVPKTNPVLQEFLHYHPNNGKEFYEFDNEKDAQEDVDFMYSELDAQLMARDMDFGMMEAVAQVLLGGKVSKMTSAEIKRDIMLYAKRYPQDFMETVNDPSLRVNNIASRAISDGYLSLRNNKKDIYFNLKENRKKLMTIPFGEDPVYVLASYLQSNDGLELFKFLDEKISDN